MRYKPRSKRPKPTMQDAHDFLRRGFYVGPADYISAEEQVRELEKALDEVRSLVKSGIPRGYNLEFVLLKCHVVVEYAINRYIELVSPRACDISSERFSFAQKVFLLHLLGVPDGPILIPSFEALNRLRNQVAHTLEVNQSLLDDFIRINSEDPDEVPTMTDRQKVTAIKEITRGLCGLLMGYADAQSIGAYQELEKSRSNFEDATGLTD